MYTDSTPRTPYKVVQEICSSILECCPVMLSLSATSEPILCASAKPASLPSLLAVELSTRDVSVF